MSAVVLVLGVGFATIEAVCGSITNAKDEVAKSAGTAVFLLPSICLAKNCLSFLAKPYPVRYRLKAICYRNVRFPSLFQ